MQILSDEQKESLRSDALDLANLVPGVLENGEKPPQFWSLLDDIIEEHRTKAYPQLRRTFAAQYPVSNIKSMGDVHRLLFEYEGVRPPTRNEILDDLFESFDQFVSEFPHLYAYLHDREWQSLFFQTDPTGAAAGDWTDVETPPANDKTEVLSRERMMVYKRFEIFAEVRDYLEQLADWTGEYGRLAAIPQKGSFAACVKDDGTIYTETAVIVEIFEGFNIHKIRRCLYETCRNIFIQARKDQEYCGKNCRDNARGKRYRQKHAEKISERRAKAYKEKCDDERKKS